MFRKSKAKEIGKFFALPLKKNELAVFYLGVSGFVARTSNQAVLIDPAGLLKNDEIMALKIVNLVLFTHNHFDHFRSDTAQAVFKATNAPIIAEPKVANKLKGKIPADKLTSAESGKIYTFGGINATAIQGIHRGPIMLYQIRMDDIVLFHAGDSGYVALKDYTSDLALLPTGRMSPTASPENAYKMASDLKPYFAIAMHGSEKQKRDFEKKIKEAMPQVAILIVEPYTAQTMRFDKKK